MGRIEPSHAPLAQQSFRKDQRAKNARATINKTIPQILASEARARKGVENARLITASDLRPQVGPSSRPTHVRNSSKVGSPISCKGKENPTQQPDLSSPERSDHGTLKVRIQVADTLIAARELHQGSRSKKNVAILNMASPLRPGGGVLNGATSQEESLCSRTTLLSSLREEWYRLPEVGGIWSPDVLVFRIPGPKGDVELPRKERFYIDAISAAMIRFPDVVDHAVDSDNVDDEENDQSSDNGSSEQGPAIENLYANQRDRDLALEKMRTVLQILVLHKTERVVLGAWGCGAYGNPVKEIAAAWKRALLGTRKSGAKGQVVNLGSLREVVFAIKDPRMADAFARLWGDRMEVERAERSDTASVDDTLELHMKELSSKIEALQLQIAEAKTPLLKQGLEGTLQKLKEEVVKADKESDDEGEDSED